MKCFQVLSGFVHWEATRLYPSVADIPPNTYAPDIQFIDAPDYVFEGWGYDETAEGDARFIQPTPPDGWLYDPDTGLFYPEHEPVIDGGDATWVLNQLEGIDDGNGGAAE